MNVPATIDNVEQLEDLLSEPTPAAIAALGRLDGDLIVLGVGGKMGPTLARMARRAFDAAGKRNRVIGVARFSDPRLPASLQSHGVETIRCDLLDPIQLAKLPDAPNVICMTGMKFGATGQAALTWAMNVLVPAMICQKYAQSRIVAFSTGNVYGLTPVTGIGSREEDELRPVGEYAMTAVGRERMFEHFSRTHGTSMAVLRLYYATEMRYGVLVDIARKVWAREHVPVAMGYLNSIWQGDANAMSLAAFDHLASPPMVLNIAGPEQLKVRQVAADFGHLLSRPVRFEGIEAADALLANTERAKGLFGLPRVTIAQMMRWIADWVQRGGASLDKPTHFENRAGNF